MRFLVHVEAEFSAAEKLDTSPGGPGLLFGQIAERFKPEAFWVEASRRAAWWVIDFADVQAITELTHLLIARAGAQPDLRPILTASEAPKAIGKAIERARDR